MKEKHHFSVVTHLNPVSQPGKHLLKNNFLHHFLFLIRPFLEKKDHFDISFACSFFFLKAGKSLIEVFWVWPTSQLASRRKRPINPSGIILCRFFSISSSPISHPCIPRYKYCYGYFLLPALLNSVLESLYRS